MTNHALLIGAGGDLPNTMADANGLAKILADPSRCAFAQDNVKVLTEREADRAKVLAALDQLAKDAAPDSTVIVYFSGHGGEVKASVGKFYFLMPFAYDTQNLANTAISGREFADKLAAIPAQRLLLLLDCCHARGVAAESAEIKSGISITQSPIPPEAEKLLAEGSGRAIIASSKAEQYSFTGKPYSLFTRALIQGLCGADLSEADGFVKVADLAMYTREKVSQWSRTKQQPMFDPKRSDNFRVAYYAGGATKPKGLEDLGLPPIDEEQIAQENAPTTIINQDGGIRIGDGNTLTVLGDMVGGNMTTVGDSITVGDITNSSGVAIGRDARASSRSGVPAGQLGTNAVNNTAGADADENSPKQKLYRALNESFNPDEMKELAFLMKVNWDNLSGDTQSAKARELVSWFERHDKLDTLRRQIMLSRPHLKDMLS